MIGAIIGDFIGSHIEVLEYKGRSYEDRIKVLDPNTPLITPDCSCTDDTILTAAIANKILNGGIYEENLREFCLREINLGLDKYGRSRFGKGTMEWATSLKEGNSYGNGGAMRVSAIGLYFDTLEEVKRNTIEATIPSHNHPEAIKGSLGVATSIYILKNGYSKNLLKGHIYNNYYNLDYNLESLQRNNKFSSKATDTVPLALYCFLISNNFEDAMRKALSIGGDTDTICSIVGALSEAYYGIDEKLYEQVKPFIPGYIQDIINKFYSVKTLRKSGI